MPDVMFEWADGPNAGNQYHYLWAFTENGDCFSPRMEAARYNKNGKWSYVDRRVYVPEGTFILTVDRNNHRNVRFRLWKAVESRPEILSGHGNWASHSTYPYINPDKLDIAIWQKMLKQCVVKEVIDQWEANASVKNI